MKFEDYQTEARQTALYPRRLENLEYPTLGLAGEAGEVANIVKKIQRDHGGIINDEVRGKLKDELGDVLWYISACADELGLTQSTTFKSWRNVIIDRPDVKSRTHGLNRSRKILCL
jgi:NTP pyrophosphatase (non-canonical NTP hydrolase)